MQWLNDSDTINFYAVKVSAYGDKENYSYKFKAVVVPQSHNNSSSSYTKNANTLYAEFYQPMTAELI